MGAGVLLWGLSCDFEKSTALCLWEALTPAFVIYPFPDGFLPCPQFVFYLIYLTVSHFQRNYLLFIIVFGGPENQTHIIEQAK